MTGLGRSLTGRTCTNAAVDAGGGGRFEVTRSRMASITSSSASLYGDGRSSAAGPLACKTFCQRWTSGFGATPRPASYAIASRACAATASTSTHGSPRVAQGPRHLALIREVATTGSQRFGLQLNAAEAGATDVIFHKNPRSVLLPGASVPLVGKRQPGSGDAERERTSAGRRRRASDDGLRAIATRLAAIRPVTSNASPSVNGGGEAPPRAQSTIPKTRRRKKRSVRRGDVTIPEVQSAPFLADYGQADTGRAPPVPGASLLEAVEAWPDPTRIRRW